ncbi:MAG: DNA recombination protein RmuC [Methanomassiliicoccaceae archaeon]|nr:DNA recombination protein RmuC [Methanomassiliicoccaceae archaeon]
MDSLMIVTIAMLALLIILMVINLFLVLKKKERNDMPPELDRRLNSLETAFGRFDPMIREEFASNRDESAKAARDNRKELIDQQERMSLALDAQLKEIRSENEKKLEEMKKTVDENLKTTVEKRFDESFKIINERLEQVHKGLGEMKQLASGVDDLKKVLANVKTKGTLGEIQLGSILEQILSPGQYEAQMSVKEGSLERVDYAIKLPDKNSMNGTLLLPIDSKFPTEDYQRMLDASGTGVYDSASAAFLASVKKSAKDIHDKYINPPKTTDFAIMFVPAEGIYAEIVRRTELFEFIRNTYKVTVVGPTNLSAFLSSLQMGFRTLAIERRSSEVWEILGAVKMEFRKYGDLMDSIKKKIDSAAKEIDTVGTRTRAIERKLKDVEELPAGEGGLLLRDGADDAEL